MNLTRRRLLGTALAGAATPAWASPKAEETTSGHIGVPGGAVFWRRLASGSNIPVLLLHGGPGLPADYLDPLAHIGGQHPVFTYDQLGCGLSDQPASDALWTLERFVDELVEVRRALGLKTVHLFAHSWGTMLAAEYLFARKPAGVGSVIFASPCLSAERFKADTHRLARELSDEDQNAIFAAEASGDFSTPEYKSATDRFFAKHVIRSNGSSPYLLKSLKAWNRSVHRLTWGPSAFSVRGNLKSFDRTADLQNLRTPSLFLCGEFDECTPATTRDYASLTPHGRFAVVPRASHMMMIEAPSATNRIVARFLKKVEAG